MQETIGPVASGQLTGLLRNAAVRAAGLAGGLLVLLGLSGEIGCTLTNAGGVQVLHLDLAAPRFAPLVVAMAGWDLLVFGLAWFFLMRIPATPAGSRGRAALSLILSLSLWRVVAGRAWALATDTPGPTVATASEILAWWVYAALVAVIKEPIAQTLLEEDERQDSPLLSVFAWHHRKDGVFSLLGALALTLVWFGMPAAVADDLQNLVKIGLLGTAAMRIGHRCLVQLTTPDGTHDHSTSPPTRTAGSPLPPGVAGETRNGNATRNKGDAWS